MRPTPWFLWCLALVWAQVGSASQDPVILSPSQLHPGTTARIGVYNPTDDASLTLSLLAGEDVVFTQALTQSGTTEVLEVDIPADISGPCTFELTGNGLSNTTSVDLAGAGDFFLVFEMDKKMYKAGQTVRARVLGLKPDLTPATNKAVTVEILDPNEFIILRSETALDEFGVAVVEMETAAEPVLGTWTLKATQTGGAVTAQETFKLDEYVLPKFEVEVHADQSLLVSSSPALTGTVKATYTFGEPVQGSVTLQLLQTDDYAYGWDDWGPRGGMDIMPLPGPEGPPASVLFEEKVDLRGGEAGFSVSVAQLQNINWWGGGLSLEAVVTEAATGATQNATADVGIAMHRYTVKITGPSTFTEGQAYAATVNVEDILGPPPSGSVQVKVRVDTQGYRASDTYPTRTGSVSITDGVGDYMYTVPEADSECCAPEDLGVYNRDSCCISGISVEALFLSTAEGTLEEDANLQGHWVYRRGPAGSGGAQLSVAEAAPTEGGASVFEVEVALAAAPPAGSRVQYAVLGLLGVVAGGSVELEAAPAAGPATAQISVAPTGAMSPEAHLVVYFLAPGADEEQPAQLLMRGLAFAPAFRPPHQVALAFGAQEAVPGASVPVQATGGAGSRIYLLAVDRSVTLLSGEPTALTAAGLLSAAARQFKPPGHRPQGCWSLGEGDAVYEAAQAGGALLTSAAVRQCGETGDWLDMEEDMEADFMPLEGGAMPVPGMGGGAAFDKAAPSQGAGGGMAAVRRVRKFFPEAWLWRHVDVGASGAANLEVTAPDTITTWDLTAFGVSPSLGVGVADQASSLKVFKPFFVSAALPYSIVRGETATIRVAVFNYLESDTQVEVDIKVETSAAEVVGSGAASVAAAAGGAASVSFQVKGTGVGAAVVTVTGRTPAAVGAADSVQRPLLVKAEGRPVSKFATAVLSRGAADGGAALEKMLNVTLPAEVVPGSARAQLTAIGDLMGASISGIESLLRMPFGCGEQNMISTAPNVFVARYLAGSGKLAREPALAEKARKHMLSGWQRQLTYRHPDNSFSAFGTSDSAGGSTWLTAFVVKTFSQAREFVYIDPAALQGAVAWLAGTQARDGAFAERGHVIHTEMQGGAGAGLSLTAFVLVALLEAAAAPGGGVEVAPEVVNGAVSYLVSSLGLTQAGSSKADQYAATLATYSIALACSSMQLEGACEAEGGAVQALTAAAIPAAGTLHWENGEPEEKRVSDGSGDDSPIGIEPLWCPEPVSRSTDVEMTGYALLALLAAGEHSSTFPAARWMLEQRNDRGGFASTQDTVVGLQALGAYASAVYADSTDMALRLSTASGFSETLQVNNGNIDILQQREVPVGQAVSIAASGAGIALVQLSVTYNELAPPQEPAFELEVTWRNLTAGGEQVEALVCTQLAPAAAKEPGMTVVEVGLFSGFAVDKAALAGVKGRGGVKRADVAADASKVELYLDTVGTEPSCSRFTAFKQSQVADLRPAVSTVYSYYHPEMNTLVASEYAAAVVATPAATPAPTPTPAPTELDSAPTEGRTDESPTDLESPPPSDKYGQPPDHDQAAAAHLSATWLAVVLLGLGLRAL